MIFDKEAFTRNAEPHIKKLIPAAHIDVLDGKEVLFKDTKFGEVTHYEVDGEEFYLFPVAREWCTELNVNQMSLFDYMGGD